MQRSELMEQYWRKLRNSPRIFEVWVSVRATIEHGHICSFKVKESNASASVVGVEPFFSCKVIQLPTPLLYKTNAHAILAAIGATFREIHTSLNYANGYEVKVNIYNNPYPEAIFRNLDKVVTQDENINLILNNLRKFTKLWGFSKVCVKNHIGASEKRTFRQLWVRLVEATN